MHSTSALLVSQSAWAMSSPPVERSASAYLAQVERDHHRVARRLERLETLQAQQRPADTLSQQALHLEQALTRLRGSLQQEASGLVIWADLQPYLQGVRQLEKEVRHWRGEGQHEGALSALLLQAWRTLGGGLMLLRVGRMMAEQAEQATLNPEVLSASNPSGWYARQRQSVRRCWQRLCALPFLRR